LNDFSRDIGEKPVGPVRHAEVISRPEPRIHLNALTLPKDIRELKEEINVGNRGKIEGGGGSTPRDYSHLTTKEICQTLAKRRTTEMELSLKKGQPANP